MKRPNPYANIETSELVVGATAALKNAKDYESIANLVASDGKHGQAVALYVLGIEEAVKGYMLYMSAASGGELNEMLPDIFKDHVLKHSGAALTMFMLYFFGTAKALHDEGEEKIKHGAPAKATREAGMQEYFQMIKTWAEDETSSLPRLLAWYKDANNRKKSGFYVDWVDGAWVSPEKITHKESDEARENSREWISCVEAIFRVPLSEIAKSVEEFMREERRRKRNRGQVLT